MAHNLLLQDTICPKGHNHPPWNTSGVLQIAKCETICGFCQKETKTAANLRKHVAIHIKNERLDLVIAEGSSGRGRLEVPHPSSSSSLSIKREDANSTEIEHSPSMMSGISRGRNLSLPVASLNFPSVSHMPDTHRTTSFPEQSFRLHNHQPDPCAPSHYSPPPPLQAPIDPFFNLRKHELATKWAWTAIPTSEGLRILNLCRSMSSTTSSSPGSSSPPEMGRVPCYHRDQIFDDEWQSHMSKVHGVVLLWPDTWMRRVEILDLDRFGGDISTCNQYLMER